MIGTRQTLTKGRQLQEVLTNSIQARYELQEALLNTAAGCTTNCPAGTVCMELLHCCILLRNELLHSCPEGLQYGILCSCTPKCPSLLLPLLATCSSTTRACRCFLLLLLLLSLDLRDFALAVEQQGLESQADLR
jgi:hypothetical protein